MGTQRSSHNSYLIKVSTFSSVSYNFEDIGPIAAVTAVAAVAAVESVVGIYAFHAAVDVVNVAASCYYYC